MNTFSVELKSDTNFVYTFFVWTASNCSPNRDGGTGEIRVDPQRRVFTTQECFNQNVKNGVFFANQSGLVDASEGCELMGCKNEFFLGQESLTRKKAMYNLLGRLSSTLNISRDKLKLKHVFARCFDLPLFGFVASDCLGDPAVPHSFTGSCGLVYLPKTVTAVSISNRGISNSFANPPKAKSGAYKKVKTSDDYEVVLKENPDDDPLAAQDMPGSHYTDYLEEGVFCSIGLLNVKQLKYIAQQRFGVEDEGSVHSRIQQLYNLYLTGLWEGFKLLGYASTMRKGQQPYALYSAQRQTLPDYIPDPAAILMNEDGNLPMHESFAKTINALEAKLPEWKKRISDEWNELKKMEL